jgi:hypothetical protein
MGENNETVQHSSNKEIQMINEYGTVGGLVIGKENQSTRRKSAIDSLIQPRIPHDLTLDQTRATAVEI